MRSLALSLLCGIMKLEAVINDQNRVLSFGTQFIKKTKAFCLQKYCSLGNNFLFRCESSDMEQIFHNINMKLEILKVPFE